MPWWRLWAPRDRAGVVIVTALLPNGLPKYLGYSKGRYLGGASPAPVWILITAGWEAVLFQTSHIGMSNWILHTLLTPSPPCPPLDGELSVLEDILTDAPDQDDELYNPEAEHELADKKGKG